MDMTVDRDSLHENNSGQGKNTPVPRELQKWNWGAFALNWIWGLANETYIALLCFVPFVGLAMPFVLGAKGNEWAWQNRRWQSIAHFQKVQRGWAIASLVILVLGGAATILLVTTFSSLFDEVGVIRKMAADRLREHPTAIEVLGEPISVGITHSFHINETATRGNAELDLAVSGPLDRGVLRVEALRILGDWQLTVFHLTLHSDEIDLLAEP